MLGQWDHGKAFVLGFGEELTIFTMGVQSVSLLMNHFPSVCTVRVAGPKKLHNAPRRPMVIVAHIPHLPRFGGLGFHSVLELDQVIKYFWFFFSATDCDGARVERNRNRRLLSLGLKGNGLE